MFSDWDSYLNFFEDKFEKELMKFIKDNNTLKHLLEERVLQIHSSENGIFLTEGCDSYFGVKLNKKLCNDISDTFKNLADFLDK